MDVFPFELAVFVDNVVKRVYVHARTEAKQNVPHHFVDFYGPLHRGETVCVDRVPDVKMKKIKLLLDFVEGRLYQRRIGKREMSGECRVVRNE
jgi:hypothetical protein